MNRIIVPVALAALTLAAVWWLRRPADSSPQPLPVVVAAPAGSEAAAANPQPAGTGQPLAPGYKAAAPLPTIALSPSVPEVRSVEYLSNGAIKVASALILVPKATSNLAHTLDLAQIVVARTYAARPGLTEVDVSLYQREGYAGYGGPSPLLTASVPRARLADFERIKANAVDEYDRLWVNPEVAPLPPQVEATGETPVGAPEPPPGFVGSPEDLATERAKQRRDASEGGQKGGSYFHGDPRRPMAALTFDDAVHPLYAPLILDALRRTGAKATFFVVGRNVKAYPYFVRDLAREGHEIANHTYHHVRLVGLSAAQVRDELERTNALVQAITGEPVRYFRPPGGRYSKEVLRVASSLKLTTAFWTDDPADFNNPGATLLEKRFLKHLRRGGIVLLHDNAQQTAPLLTDFANDARTAGIALVTLETLATGP